MSDVDVKDDGPPAPVPASVPAPAPVAEAQPTEETPFVPGEAANSDDVKIETAAAPSEEDKDNDTSGADVKIEVAETVAAPDVKIEIVETAATPDVKIEIVETAATPDVKIEIVEADKDKDTSGAKVKIEIAETVATPANIKDEKTEVDEKVKVAETSTTPASVKEETGTIVKTKDSHDKPHKYFNNRVNVKSDPSVLPETDDPREIRHQAEHYFSDYNLPGDEHMWSLTGGDENKPVSLQTISSFGRMRRFPYAAVVTALRDSPHLVVEGEEGKETIKRKQAYVKTGPDGHLLNIPRSIYAKGFGEEDSSTQYDLEAFFRKFGDVKNLKLRRDDRTRLWKRSVFVQFASEEEANSFVKLEPAPTYEGKELKIMKKEDYIEEKNKLYNIKPDAERKRRSPFWEGENARKHFKGGRGGRGGDNRATNPDDWKKRRDQDQKNGFKDNRNRNGQRGRGHGHGRGGRGGRGGRDRQEQRNNDPAPPKSTNNVTIPEIKTTPNPKSKKKAAEQGTNGKRAREDDDKTGEPSAKKVDTKETAVAAA